MENILPSAERDQAPHPRQDAREEAVRQAIASARMEGVNASAGTRAILARFVAGEIGEDEMMQEILKENARRN